MQKKFHSTHFIRSTKKSFCIKSLLSYQSQIIINITVSYYLNFNNLNSKKFN